MYVVTLTHRCITARLVSDSTWGLYDCSCWGSLQAARSQGTSHTLLLLGMGDLDPAVSREPALVGLAELNMSHVLAYMYGQSVVLLLVDTLPRPVGVSDPWMRNSCNDWETSVRRSMREFFMRDTCLKSAYIVDIPKFDGNLFSMVVKYHVITRANFFGRTQFSDLS